LPWSAEQMELPWWSSGSGKGDRASYGMVEGGAGVLREV
jgi:hypothetical protein